MLHVCQRSQCGRQFKSKHSTAKYCSRYCSNVANNYGRNNQHSVEKKYSDEYLLSCIVSLAEKLGRTPAKRDLKSPTDRTFRNRFGSWNNAIEAAGLTPNVQVPPSYLLRRRKEVKLSIRFRVLKRDGFTCRYCGGTPDLGYVLHVDHVIAGGPTVEDNLVTACWL